MKANKSSGFTIIEVTLVLAISALLIVGILGGATAAINRQRYHDSVMSLEGFLKQQYISVTRVVNKDRAGGTGYVCDSSADVSEAGLGAAKPRGTSDCVVLGRVVNVTNGTDISAMSVIGHEPSGPAPSPAPTSDVDVLKTYQLSLFQGSKQTSEVGWSSSITDENFGILLLRSPLSGNIVTFVSPEPIDNSADLESTVDNGVMTEDKELCVSPDGLFAGQPMSVIIRQGAAGPAGVEQLGEASGC